MVCIGHFASGQNRLVWEAKLHIPARPYIHCTGLFSALSQLTRSENIAVSIRRNSVARYEFRTEETDKAFLFF